YPNRLWCGKVFYHYGNRPQGECRSERVEVWGAVRDVVPFLGPDTLITLPDSLVLSPGAGYSSYLWSTGSTGSTIILSGSYLGIGTHLVHVNVTDAWGCHGSDSIIVNVTLTSSFSEASPVSTPWISHSAGMLRLDWPGGCGRYRAMLYDPLGRIVGKAGAGDSQIISVKGRAPGIYTLIIHSDQIRSFRIPIFN
ncbi:MAG: PKD domain-containing protein, partial [Bacteroidales bacterium]|nr:PKD domain-containing protein [Bacteroidales bacterium]